MSELHSGMRAYGRKVLDTIRWEDNSDEFVFDSEFIFQTKACGFKFGEIGVPCRYFPEASSSSFKKVFVYSFFTLWICIKYLLHRLGIVKFKMFTPALYIKNEAG